MIPGGPRNMRQMEMMMKRLGMSTEEVPNVEEVIIRTREKEHVFREPEVTVLTVQGVRTYQVVGDVTVRPRTAGRADAAEGGAAPAAPAAPSGPPDEDVQLVMEQAGVDRAEALEALRATDGAPAEAILHLLSRKGGGGG
jgi:nascent polypeptide-associated complex subunit alpha